MAISPLVRVLLASTGLLAAGAGIWRGTRAVEPGDFAQRGDRVETTLPASSPRGDSVAQDPARRAAADPPAADYALIFQKAGNYRQFITAALPAARAGNADAQFYVHAALKYCEETYRVYFKLRDKVLSVDEAIAVQTSRGSFQYIEGLRRADGRCREVNGNPDPSWEAADEWLARAALAGQPMALLRKATRIFLEIDTRGESILRKSDGAAYSLEDARAMVRAAARSGSPDVLFEVGDMGLLMKPDSEPDGGRESLVWRYVACLRGLDCSAGAEWHRQFCSFDADCRLDEPGMDYLRRMALQGGSYDLELRASLINERINAGDWAALGLGE